MEQLTEIEEQEWKMLLKYWCKQAESSPIAVEVNEIGYEGLLIRKNPRLMKHGGPENRYIKF